MTTTTEVQASESLEIEAPNAVEQLIGTEFCDPDLWTEIDQIPDLENTKVFGITYRNKITDLSTGPGVIIQEPKRTWLFNIYGLKLDRDPEHPRRARIMATDLDTLTAIHRRLSETALAGEGIHVATITKPPHPYSEHGSSEDLENNMHWLELISEGKWPIFLLARADGSLKYEPHDSASTHLAVMALLPLEAQHLITEAAKLEREHRLIHKPEPVREDDGEQYFISHPHHKPIGNSDYGSHNMVSLIDRLTDNHAYLEVLQELVAAEDNTLEQVLVELLESKYAHFSSFLKHEVGELISFISWHKENKKVTDTERDDAYQQVLGGIVRVAHKIRGDYQADAEAA